MSAVFTPEQQAPARPEHTDPDLAGIKRTGSVQPVDPETTSDLAHLDLVVTAKWDMWVNWIMIRLRVKATHARPANRADAEDIVQEMVLVAYQYRHNYFRKEGAPLAAWLMWLLKVRFYQAPWGAVHRTQKKRPRLVLVEARKLAPLGGVCSPIAAVENRDGAEVAMAAMTPLQRRLVGLRFYEGMGLTEIARRCGVGRRRVPLRLTEGFMRARRASSRAANPHHCRT
jgi:RNA polymerase sigma factor (sigma-70 family)